jgi:hypothetical protein
MECEWYEARVCVSGMGEEFEDGSGFASKLISEMTVYRTQGKTT